MTSRHGWNQFWHWRPKTDSRFNDTTRPGWHWDLADIGRTSDWCRLNYLTAVVRIYAQDRNRGRGSKSVRIEVKMTQLDLKMRLTIQCRLTWSVSANPKNDRLNLGSWISCKGLWGVSSTLGLSKASRFSLIFLEASSFESDVRGLQCQNDTAKPGRSGLQCQIRVLNRQSFRSDKV